MISSTNQVCSLELSRKLAAAGVVVDSMFTWVFDYFNNRWTLSGHPITAIRLIDSGNKQREAYPAYTIYELGRMFGQATTATERLYTNVQRELNKGLSFHIVFDPDYLAKELFYSIANGFTTVSECIERIEKTPYDSTKSKY